MFEKSRTILIFLSMILMASPNNQFVQYKKYLNKEIANEKLLVNSTPDSVFQAQALAFCMIRCNLNSECELISYNKQNQCKMFTNQTVFFDLTGSNTTNVYSKNAIKSCLKEDFYADVKQMVCLKKKLNGVGCDNNDECLKTLECSNLTCGCISPTEK